MRHRRQLGRLADVGDQVTVTLRDTLGADGRPIRAGQATLRVEQTHRRVPRTVRMSVDNDRDGQP
jgi:hypothetical protein